MCKPRKTSYNREILEKQEKRDKEMFLGLQKLSRLKKDRDWEETMHQFHEDYTENSDDG